MPNVSRIFRDLSAAFARYTALTGDTRASLDDPVVRRFCDEYQDAAGAVQQPSGLRTAHRLYRFSSPAPSGAEPE